MTQAPTPTTYLDSVTQTLNAVDDLGWDNQGDEPIQAPPVDENTLILLPEGTYKIPETGFRFAEEVRNWGMLGLGGDPLADDPVFVPDAVRFVAENDAVVRAFDFREFHHSMLGNFVFDMGENWDCAMGVALLGSDMLVESVQFRGWRPNEHQGSTGGLVVFTRDNANATAYVSNFYADERVALAEYPKNAIPFGSYPPSHGTLYLLDSVFENGGEHGVYASRVEGDVKIERCLFRNNQNTHARISGEGSYAKDCAFIWDTTHDNPWFDPNNGAPDSGNPPYQAQTGLVFEAGFQGFTGGRVENCNFFAEATAPNSGVLKVDGSQGGVSAHDCRILVDADQRAPAINAERPGDSHMIEGLPAEPWDVTLDNVDVTHKGRPRWTHTHAVMLRGRASRVHNLHINSEGDSGGLFTEDVNLTISGDSRISAATGAHFDRITSSIEGDFATDPEPDLPEKLLPTPTPDETENAGTVYPNHATIEAAGDADVTHWTVTVSGPASLVTTGATASETSGEYAEEVVDNGDGTYTITGYSARSGMDAFDFEGDLIWWGHDGGEGAITLTINDTTYTSPVPKPADPSEPSEPSEPSVPDETADPTETFREAVEAAGIQWYDLSPSLVLLADEEGGFDGS